MSAETAPDVVGPGEACRMLKISRATLQTYKARPGFPPARRLGIGDVWSRPALAQWRREHPKYEHSS